MDRIQQQELVRSYQVGAVTRRQFLIKATALFGSVAAANTLLAACVPPTAVPPPPVVDESQPAAAPGTESDGELVTGYVNYPGPEGEELMGYIAYQDDGVARPAVVVIQEWWGVDDHIKDLTHRFAKEGFVVLAPDLYNGAVTTEPDEARKLVMELGMRDAVGQIQQAISYLQDQDFVSGGVGIIGFCMGGGLVLQTVANDSDNAVAAAVSFYGTSLSEDEAGQVSAPTLSFLGTEDRIPVEGLEAMHAVFEENGIEHDFTVYEGVQHAFFNDTRANSYNADAATDAWEQTLAWFRTNLES